ncbi:sdpA [Symbiodinium natans]|uniref:SdpA protein n=1 Tax=Symbiodinium natans TaxID=878477 RepID=A0A812SI97_9DINO|nr:sdpA [Symbiodinium natans]
MPDQARSRSPPAAKHGGKLRISPLKGRFGALIETPLTADRILSDAGIGLELLRAWQGFGGLLVLRGLQDLSPTQLVDISALFGEVENELDDSKKRFAVQGETRVMRIGNTRDPETKLATSLNANDPPLPEGGSPQYRLDDRRPFWHTDSVYRKDPPIGSLLYCKQQPPEGGATCFADAVSSYEALDVKLQEKLKDLECLCSQAHHDAKVHRTSPDFPTLTPEERAASPAQRVPRGPYPEGVAFQRGVVSRLYWFNELRGGEKRGDVVPTSHWIRYLFSFFC